MLSDKKQGSINKMRQAHVDAANARTLENLRECVQFCEENGYKPEPGTSLNTKLTSAKMLVYLRQKKGAIIPKEITDLLNKVNSWDTKLQRDEKNKPDPYLEWKKIVEKQKEITPYALLLKGVFGEEIVEDALVFKDDILLLEQAVKSAMADLDDRYQRILMAFFGINQPELRLEEIGDNEGIVRERVRQIKEKAVRILRNNEKVSAAKETLLFNARKRGTALPGPQNTGR